MEDYHDDIRSMVKSKRAGHYARDHTADDERFFTSVMKAEEMPEQPPAPAEEEWDRGGVDDSIVAELNALFDEIAEAYGEDVADDVLSMLAECPEIADEVEEVQAEAGAGAEPVEKSAIAKLYGDEKRAGEDGESVGDAQFGAADRPAPKVGATIGGEKQQSEEKPASAPGKQSAAPGFRQKLHDKYNAQGQDIWNRWGQRLRDLGGKIRSGLQTGLGMAAAGAGAVGDAAEEAGYQAGTIPSRLGRWYHGFQADRMKRRAADLQQRAGQHADAAGKAAADLRQRETARQQ